MQYAIYKGTGGRYGAIQFNFQKPHFYNGKQKDYTGSEAFELVDGRKKLKEGWKEREGCVFLEIAPPVDKNKYDWNQKIIMAFSVNDMAKLSYFLTLGKSPNKKERNRQDGQPSGSMVIMHDPHAKSDRAGQTQKYFRIYSPDGPADGAMITVVQKEGDQKREHQVPVSGDEVVVLRALLTSAMSNALNW